MTLLHPLGRWTPKTIISFFVPFRRYSENQLSKSFFENAPAMVKPFLPICAKEPRVSPDFLDQLWCSIHCEKSSIQYSYYVVLTWMFWIPWTCSSCYDFLTKGQLEMHSSLTKDDRYQKLKRIQDFQSQSQSVFPLSSIEWFLQRMLRRPERVPDDAPDFIFQAVCKLEREGYAIQLGTFYMILNYAVHHPFPNTKLNKIFGLMMDSIKTMTEQQFKTLVHVLIQVKKGVVDSNAIKMILNYHRTMHPLVLSNGVARILGRQLRTTFDPELLNLLCEPDWLSLEAKMILLKQVISKHVANEKIMKQVRLIYSTLNEQEQMWSDDPILDCSTAQLQGYLESVVESNDLSRLVSFLSTLPKSASFRVEHANGWLRMLLKTRGLRENSALSALFKQEFVIPKMVGSGVWLGNVGRFCRALTALSIHPDCVHCLYYILCMRGPSIPQILYQILQVADGENMAAWKTVAQFIINHIFMTPRLAEILSPQDQREILQVLKRQCQSRVTNTNGERLVPLLNKIQLSLRSLTFESSPNYSEAEDFTWQEEGSAVQDEQIYILRSLTGFVNKKEQVKVKRHFL